MSAAGSAHANAALRWGNMWQLARLASIAICQLALPLSVSQVYCCVRELTGTRLRIRQMRCLHDIPSFVEDAVLTGGCCPEVTLQIPCNCWLACTQHSVCKLRRRCTNCALCTREFMAAGRYPCMPAEDRAYGEPA